METIFLISSSWEEGRRKKRDNVAYRGKDKITFFGSTLWAFSWPAMRDSAALSKFFTSKQKQCVRRRPDFVEIERQIRMVVPLNSKTVTGV